MYTMNMTATSNSKLKFVSHKAVSNYILNYTPLTLQMTKLFGLISYILIVQYASIKCVMKLSSDTFFDLDLARWWWCN